MLAIKIRETPQIRCLKVQDREYKIVLYADDVALFLTNTCSSIKQMTEVLQDFGVLSGCRVNQTKSEIMGINIDPNARGNDTGRYIGKMGEKRSKTSNI